MNNGTLESQVGELLRERGLRLAIAESCTGGLVGDRLTDIAGSSDYFLGGVIAYANRVKIKLLGVGSQTISQFGAVSEATVREMALGVRQVLGADIGISISGIAGPGGGSPEKPVGMVWIGLSAEGYANAWVEIWQGDRRAIKEQAAEEALRRLLEYLRMNRTTTLR